MVVVLGALFFGGNQVVKSIAEDRIGSAIETEFDLAAKPKVHISGFTVGLDILRGRLSRVSFDAQRATFDDLAVESISVVLVDVKAPDGFLRTSGLTVEVGAGTVKGKATDASINAFLKERKKDATVELHEGSVVIRATRTIFGQRRKIVARGAVAREGDDLVFRPSSVTVDGERPPAIIEGVAKRQATIRVHLPAFPAGITSYDVRAREGALEVEAVLHDQKLLLG